MCVPPKAETKTQVSVDHEPEKNPPSGEVGGQKGHPVRMEDFYKAHPSFVWGPILVAAFLRGLTLVPQIHEYYLKNNMKSFGFQAAFQYTIYAIVASYAFHGWCTTHAPHRLKVQSAKPYAVSPDAMAVRSTAALMTELVYTFMPLSPTSETWTQFFVWTAIVSIYWDLHFYWAHRYVHVNKAAYKFFHKTHHLCKDPNCFSAYFVTYQSHIVLEQSVVFIMAMAGMPKDVFIFVMYWGTIGTFIEHSGYELGTVKLPLVPFLNLGHLCTVLGLPTFFLDGVNVAEHDWHHEKFFDNYALSFKYLDKVFGTYNPGRNPGVQGEEK